MDGNSHAFVNYPRPGLRRLRPTRPPGVYFDFVGDAWQLVRMNLATWIGAWSIFGTIGLSQFFAVYGIPNGYGCVTPVPEGDTPCHLTVHHWTLLTSVVATVVCVFFANIVIAGTLHMATLQARGISIRIEDIFSGFRRVASLGLSAFGVGLAVAVGLVCGVIPGILLAATLGIVPIIVLDKELGPIEAIMLSYRTCKPHAWGLARLMMSLGFLLVVGLLAAGIGLFLAVPIVFSVIGLQYDNIFPFRAAQWTGTLDYSKVPASPP